MVVNVMSNVMFLFAIYGLPEIRQTDDNVYSIYWISIEQIDSTSFSYNFLFTMNYILCRTYYEANYFKCSKGTHTCNNNYSW